MVGILCLSALGYLLMVKSPGTWKHRIEGGKGIVRNFLDILSQYTENMQWLPVLWIVLFVLALFVNRRHRAVICSAMFMIVSAMLSFMHIVANRYPLRGMLGTTIFLIMADFYLLGIFWENRYEALVCAMSAVCVYFAAVDFFPGAYDILDTYRELKVREEYILSEREKGNLDLKIRVFSTQTKYSAAHDLRYLKKKTADDWPNVYMASYYGVNSITGLKEKK